MEAQRAIDTLRNLNDNQLRSVLQQFQESINCTSVVNTVVEQPRSPAKKAVNGHMGFRAYYSAIFQGLTQKERSTVISTLWKSDLFKREWEFLCAVYSTTRNIVGAGALPLQIFVNHAIQHLGIPEKNDFLLAFNWQITRDNQGLLQAHQTSVPEVQKNHETMDGVTLFRKCLESGMSDSLENHDTVIRKLSEDCKAVLIPSSSGPTAKASPARRGRRGNARSRNGLPLLTGYHENPNELIATIMGWSNVEMGSRTIKRFCVDDVRNIPEEIIDQAMQAPLMPYDLTSTVYGSRNPMTDNLLQVIPFEEDNVHGALQNRPENTAEVDYDFLSSGAAAPMDYETLICNNQLHEQPSVAPYEPNIVA